MDIGLGSLRDVDKQQVLTFSIFVLLGEILNSIIPSTIGEVPPEYCRAAVHQGPPIPNEPSRPTLPRAGGSTGFAHLPRRSLGPDGPAKGRAMSLHGHQGGTSIKLLE